METTATLETLETIDPSALACIHGGDGYADYKAEVSQNFNATLDRGQATWDAARQGNWGAALDNGVGTLYNGMQTFNSAVSPWIPAIGAPGGGGKGK
jgi:hypothetical protein